MNDRVLHMGRYRCRLRFMRGRIGVNGLYAALVDLRGYLRVCLRIKNHYSRILRIDRFETSCNREK